jgi:hypothetical protein
LPKRWELTDHERIALIRDLAAARRVAYVTTRAGNDMARLGLTEAGVCQAVRDHIDDGLPVDETITERASGHEGKPAYEIHHEIDARDFYVKVGIDESRSEPALVLISVHEPHWSEA